jgi:hypothetical protein
MRLIKNPFSRRLIGFALFVALASSSFAHRMTSSSVDESLSAFLAAGGTYQDICYETGFTDHNAGQTCDACRLVDSLVLPPVVASCDIKPAIKQVARSVYMAIASHSFSPDPSRPVRAPPLT